MMRHVYIGGSWSASRTPAHINILELLAAKIVLQSCCHIKLILDNMTAVAYVNKMGSTHSLYCNLVASEVWIWAKERDLAFC